MTVERLHRCIKCRDRYTYQASGEGCGRVENDGKWCPSCKLIVVAALEKVPRMFEPRWVDVGSDEASLHADIPTVADCLRWREEAQAACKKHGHIWSERIWPALIDYGGKGCQSTRGVPARDGIYQGIMFRLSTWGQSPDHSIEIEMEFDLHKDRFTGRQW